MVDANAMRECVVCGASFARDGKRIFCSKSCRLERVRRQKGSSVEGKTCAHCGATFSGASNKLFCSEPCRRKADECRKLQRRLDSNQVKDAACAECGVAFVQARTSHSYCSTKCARRRELQRARENRAIERRKKTTPVLVMRAVSNMVAISRAKERRILAAVRNADSPVAGMSDAQAWRFKYHNDHEFRQKEIQRLKTAKLKRKKRELHGLTKGEALAIYAERSSCLYCGCSLKSGGKVLDHMDPLSKGGAHDASNLVVSCADCNTRKASKPFVKWLPLVREERRNLVSDWYRRKHQAPPEQASLLLLRAA